MKTRLSPSKFNYTTKSCTCCHNQHTHTNAKTHRNDAVVDVDASVGGRCTAGNQLRDVDRGVGTNVRIVGAAGNCEAEPRRAALQLDILVQPAIVAVLVVAAGAARCVRLCERQEYAKIQSATRVGAETL